MLIEEELTGQIIGAAIEVHTALGPGLLESAYEQCLCYELSLRGIKAVRQVEMPLHYKGMQLDVGYRIDILVEGRVVLELKVAKQVTDIDRAQLLTYLKLSGNRVGILINFHVALLKDGIVRMVRG